jgi:hypothetical protein
VRVGVRAMDTGVRCGRWDGNDGQRRGCQRSPGRCGWSLAVHDVPNPGAATRFGPQPQVCARSAQTILICRLRHATIRCDKRKSAIRALTGSFPHVGALPRPDILARQRGVAAAVATRRPSRRSTPTLSAARPTTTAALPTPLPSHRRTRQQHTHIAGRDSNAGVLRRRARWLIWRILKAARARGDRSPPARGDLARWAYPPQYPGFRRGSAEASGGGERPSDATAAVGPAETTLAADGTPAMA